MFKKYKKFKRKSFLKSYLYGYYDDSIEVVFVEGLYSLLSDFLYQNDVRRLIRQLDEEAYFSLWSCLLDLKEKYPFMFSDEKEIVEPTLTKDFQTQLKQGKDAKDFLRNIKIKEER